MPNAKYNTDRTAHDVIGAGSDLFATVDSKSCAGTMGRIAMQQIAAGSDYRSRRVASTHKRDIFLGPSQPMAFRPVRSARSSLIETPAARRRTNLLPSGTSAIAFFPKRNSSASPALFALAGRRPRPRHQPEGRARRSWQQAKSCLPCRAASIQATDLRRSASRKQIRGTDAADGRCRSNTGDRC